MVIWHTVDSMTSRDSAIAELLRLVAEDRAESAPPQTNDNEVSDDS